MIRFLFYVTLCTTTILAASIDKQISTINHKLKNYNSTYKNADKNMAKSAKEILKEQQNLLKLDRQIKRLTQSYENKLDSLKKAQKKAKELQQARLKLNNSKSLLRNELSRLLAQQLSLQIVLKQKNFFDKEALMRGEIFSAISRMTKQELQHVKGKLGALLNEEIRIENRLKALTHIINRMSNDKAYLNTVRKTHAKKLAQLNKKRLKYKQVLTQSLKQKNALRKELKKLHIIKSDRLKRLAQQRQKKRATKNLSKVKVKKLGDSYERVKTIHYRKKKTIAPLARYSVLRKYGPYKDPIYNIKIFNESVTLKPKQKNATVRAIFNGKIVLAKRSASLGNFVILEHPNGMHTIYAKLDKVAPTLKIGKRIKKGAVIGRVNKELIFEITQKSYHINPLEVIQN